MSDGDDDVLRCFFAIELADGLRRAAAGVSDALRERVARSDAHALRWVRPEGLHVTLHFLGNVERSRLAEFAAAVRAAVAERSPFRLALGPLMGLPGDRRPRVLALDVEPREEIAALAEVVQRAAATLGFPREARRFRAHLTLARVKRDGRVRLPEAKRARASMSVDEIVLFRSRLPGRAGTASVTGPVYTPLERIALGGSDHPRSRTLSANPTPEEPHERQRKDHG